MQIGNNTKTPHIDGFYTTHSGTGEMRLPDYPSDEYIEVSAEKMGDDSSVGTRWQRFLGVPPPLRTWLTNTMIYVERVINFLENLQMEDITADLQPKLDFLKTVLEKIIHDFQSPNLDNGALSILGLERLQNLLFREKKGSIIRLNINMTDANKLDPSGNLGSAFKHNVLLWLQREFGIRQVSQNPEGTSFLVIDVPSHRMQDSLGRFAREINLILGKASVQSRFRYRSTLLGAFEPRVTAMYMKITADGLDVDETVETGDRELILNLQDKLIARIARSLRILAVATNVAEKDPASIGLVSGLALYDAADLPLVPGSSGYDTLQKLIDMGSGYVPASVYWTPLVKSPFAPQETNIKTMWLYPRVSHDLGTLDYPERQGEPGGALQIMQRLLGSLARAATAEEKEAVLVELKKALKLFSRILLLGERTRTNIRNPAMLKYIQGIKLHDGTRRIDSYFMEDVALRPEPDVHILVAEIDSFKAFSTHYPIDEEDSNFWRIFDQFLWVAKKLSIRQPVMTQVAGDLIAVAVPTKDNNGEPVDLAEFINQVQEKVRKEFSDKPFQDAAKVQVPNGSESSYRVDRLPLWQVGDRFVPAWERPEDAVPFMRTLTISATGVTMPTPVEGKDWHRFPRIIDELAAQVEKIKEESAPQKNASRVVSYEDLSAPLTFMETLNERLGNAHPEWSNVPADVRENLLSQWTTDWKNASGQFYLNHNWVGVTMAQYGYTPIQFPPITMPIIPMQPIIPMAI